MNLVEIGKDQSPLRVPAAGLAATRCCTRMPAVFAWRVACTRRSTLSPGDISQRRRMSGCSFMPMLLPSRRATNRNQPIRFISTLIYYSIYAAMHDHVSKGVIKFSVNGFGSTCSWRTNLLRNALIQLDLISESHLFSRPPVFPAAL